MAFPIIPKKRSGSAGNPTSLQLGELATNTATGELFLGGDAGVMLLNSPTSAGTTVTEHTGDGTTVAFTFTGYSTNADGAYIISVGGIDQPPSKYSISNTNGGTITFVEAPVAGELISIRAIVAGGGGGGSGDATSLQGRALAATAPTNEMAVVWNEATSTWEPGYPKGDAFKLQGVSVSNNTPTGGQVLAYDVGTSTWAPSDASGNATSLQGTGVSQASPSIGQGLVFDGLVWAPAAASTNATQIQNINVSITTPSAGDSLVYNSQTTEWVPSAPSTNATRLQGVDVTNAAPSAGDSLVYDSALNQWTPQAIIPGAQLTTTAPLPLSSTAQVGIDTTAARSDHRHAFPTALQVGALGATAAAGGDLTGNFPNPTLAAITTAQTVGSATQVPVVTVDAKGRVTGMTTAANPQGTVTSVVGGTGLTGGTITSSGTLAVSYGTTAGTAAQGNDSRLSDSRTPTGAAGGDLSGTYPNPTLNTVAVAKGGTGQTSFTDGQLLIGNSTGNTLSKATLTAGSGVTITNGPGTITIGASGSSYVLEYLVVGGGGGGGGTYHGGGGGAGGYRSSVVGESSGGGASAEPTIAVVPGTIYPIVIGAGGAGGPGFAADSTGTSGGNSSFGDIISIGGGGGGSGGNATPPKDGKNGGSGGGGALYAAAISAVGAGTAGQGFAGGLATSANTPAYGAGGGGGAGAVGQAGTTVKGGNGGIGVQSAINGTATHRAGGGGGSVFGTASAGTGGTGGGGNGSSSQGAAGTANTGGGGGGSERTGANNPGGAGGSGVVIVRYAGSQRGTGGVVTSAGGYTIHTFVASGSFTA